MREAYEKIGANYDDACARLMGEETLARFALKFLDDESMDKLEPAMAAGDAEGAFMAAHTLKGVSQNLGFDNLYEPAVVVTEALRGADAVDGAREGMHALQQQYAGTMSALAEASAMMQPSAPMPKRRWQMLGISAFSSASCKAPPSIKIKS